MLEKFLLFIMADKANLYYFFAFSYCYRIYRELREDFYVSASSNAVTEEEILMVDFRNENWRN